jgi:hypothetical protein
MERNEFGSAERHYAWQVLAGLVASAQRKSRKHCPSERVDRIPRLGSARQVLVWLSETTRCKAPQGMTRRGAVTQGKVYF